MEQGSTVGKSRRSSVRIKFRKMMHYDDDYEEFLREEDKATYSLPPQFNKGR